MNSLTRLLCHALIATVTLLFQSANAQVPDVKTKDTGSISGRVTVGSKPAPGVLVTVTTSNLRAVAQATTDADGNFRVNGLSAGQFQVMPFTPTYVLPPNNPMSPGQTITLSSGEAAEGVDFKITRGGVITGRVTDADRRPVIEERITLLPVDENGAPARQQIFGSRNYQMYQTDDRGVYRIYGLPAGKYKVSAGQEPGRMATVGAGTGNYPRTYYPDATDLAKASIVDLNEGGEAKNIDIGLGRRGTTYTVTGRIVDADTGQPLSGVQYAYGVLQTRRMPQNQEQSYVAGMASPAIPTNGQGEFRLEGIEAGRYAVFVWSSMAPANLRTGPDVYSDPVPFEVVDSNVTNVEIKARRGLSLSGVVVLEAVADKDVLARFSKLRVAANVFAGTGSAIQMMGAGGGTSAISSDGSFQIGGLRPGRAQINVGAFSPDSAGFTISRIEHQGVGPNREIEIQPGQDVSGVRVFVTYGTGVVRGQIKVEGGTLPSDIILRVALTREGVTGGLGQVDSRGRFVIQHVVPGNYEAVLQIISIGSQTALPRGFPRMQRQPVIVADNTETEVTFTLDLTPREVP
jgi:protocatechuate 3,4-dioxygenase beta subunit